MILGVHLSLLMGPTIAVPAPLPITEALKSITVTQTDEKRSAFELTFEVGRSGPWDLPDYRLLLNPLLRPFNRVVLMVHFNLRPEILIDGFITQFQLTPSEEPGRSTLTVTGEDVSVIMDLAQTALQFPMPEIVQVQLILNKYLMLGWTGQMVIPPGVPDVNLPTEKIPTQNETDYDYLQTIAARHGYVFYVRPGLVPNTNIPYWGPKVPPAGAIPGVHKALSVNMGPQTNVDSINFTYDALAAEMVLSEAVDPNTNLPVPVVLTALMTEFPLALVQAGINQLMRTRITRLETSPATRKAALEEARNAAQTARGASIPEAFERARSRINDAAKNAVTAQGELDALRYGGVLHARTVIELRGAGFTNDGRYLVKSVTHNISKGSYKQRFTLGREGVGSVVPLVRA